MTEPSEARKRLTSQSRDPNVLLSDHNIRQPRGWTSWTQVQKLDFIARRILADSRTTTSHTEMKAEGYLSASQYERRRKREVLGSLSFDDAPPKRGVFSRKYNNPKTLRTGRDE